jgi:hypothetical protein
VTAADRAYFAAAGGGRPSAELPPQARAFISLLVVVAALKQQQLRARSEPSPVSRRPPTPAQDVAASQRTLDVQKIAAQSSSAFDAAFRAKALQPVQAILSPAVDAAAKAIGIAKTAGEAALGTAALATVGGGVQAGFASLSASASAALSGLSGVGSTIATTFAAAAPAAVPLAAAGIIGSILAPAIASGQFFSGSIDPYFDATTAAAQKRAAAQAALIRQDLTDTGEKFARRTGAGIRADVFG